MVRTRCCGWRSSGAGFGGIAAAVRLKQAGIAFTVFERSDDLGGVWNENTYPGVEVDNFAHWYSFSFRTYDWSRTHAGQQELKEYLNDTVDKFGVREHFRFGSAVERVEWTRTRSGTTCTSRTDRQNRSNS